MSVSKVILDTNVPVMASVAPNLCKDEELVMQKKCMEYIRQLTTKGDNKIVLDMKHEIMTEYENNVNKNTSMGKLFFRWLYNYTPKMDMDDLLELKRDDRGRYKDYPYDEITKNFDESDKKFVALANLHGEKPPIIEAADGKWLGYVDAFAKYGIKIEFLDYDYANKMYRKKILKKQEK
jgi:hypothetical protein